MVFGTIKAVKDLMDDAQENRDLDRGIDDETQVILKSEDGLNGTLASGESKKIDFTYGQRKALEGHYPFYAIGVHNDNTGNLVVIKPNNRDHLSLPVPNGAQNGDSYDGGFRRLEIKNKGSSSVDLTNLTILLGKTPEQIAQFS